MEMNKVKALRKGDKVAIVSLSSGMLGEDFCSHNIELGVKRLRQFGLEPCVYEKCFKGNRILREASGGKSSRFEGSVYG